MDDILEQLAQRLQVPDAEVISADEVAEWPDGKLDELTAQGVLTEIEPAKGVVCDQCEEKCYIEPNLRTCPDNGKTIGVFVCTRNSDIGRIEVDLHRLRQWRINTEELSELGYQVQVGWITPWSENNSEYFALSEAVNLANCDSIAIKDMSRLLEDTEFPVRRMHKGRRCQVHINDFRKWIKYAIHGKITDKAIEKYLEGTKDRQKSIRKKKRENSHGERFSIPILFPTYQKIIDNCSFTYRHTKSKRIYLSFFFISIPHLVPYSTFRLQ